MLTLGNRKGAALIWTAVSAFVLFATGAFAIDLGKLWLVRNELQNTADAAALAAASGLVENDFKEVYARARDMARENTADGRAVNLNFEDIEVGHWDFNRRTFTRIDPFGALPVGADGNPLLPNAVRVRASRSEEANSPVQLSFARLLGREEAGVSASAIAVGIPGDPEGSQILPPPVPRGDDSTRDVVLLPSPNHGGSVPIPRDAWDGLSDEERERLRWAIEHDPYVMYIIDTTDSVRNSARECKELAHDLLQWSEKCVVGKLITKVGLVSFDNEAGLREDLSPNVGAVYEGIEELRFGEVYPEKDHKVAEALALSMERLWREPTGEMQVDKIAYIFSDGRFSETEIQQLRKQVEAARAGRNGEPIIIYTFGIGDNVNEELLREIAEATGGRYYPYELIRDMPRDSINNAMVWLVK